MFHVPIVKHGGGRTLKWETNDAETDLFFKVHLVDQTGRIWWTVHKGNGEWWVSDYRGGVLGNFISRQASESETERAATEDGFTLNS